MKVLIIGLGSIAKKHIKAIQKLDQETQIYALRSSSAKESIEGVENIYNLNSVPKGLDFCIISNPTSHHAVTISEVLHLQVPLLIEKPVLHNLEGAESLSENIQEQGLMTYIGCSLRFYPPIQFLREKIAEKKPLEMNVYCGSYLPSWRPGTDYRECYSAKAELGGGVHLDLIHELDYTIYMLGFPDAVQRYTKRKSQLELNSNDVAHYMLEYPNTSVFITLNYYRKQPKRQIECVWEDDIWMVDLLNGSVTDGSGEEVFKSPSQIIDTYDDQLSYFWDCVKNDRKPMNDFDEALKVLRVCLSE